MWAVTLKPMPPTYRMSLDLAARAHTVDAVSRDVWRTSSVSCEARVPILRPKCHTP